MKGNWWIRSSEFACLEEKTGEKGLIFVNRGKEGETNDDYGRR